ncbi:glycosyl transferase, group 1 family [Peptoniphilus sp. ING2-D1G]|nr:glycosyl transferase, group 1 family [Peptoniphilus sp. ING2-D1G]
MKVLITTDLYKPQINGVVTSVVNLYSELKKLGVDVKILTLSKTLKSHIEGDVYYVSSFPVKVYPDVRASVAIQDKCISKLIKWSPDIIHTQCEFSTMNFAKIIAIRTKAPIVHTYHTMYEYYIRYVSKHEKVGKNLLSIFFKNLLRSCEYIIAPTNKVYKSLKKYGLTNQIKIIPTGIDLDKFNREFSEEEKNSLKKKLGIDKKDKILLSLGRVAEEKNIDEIINYFTEYEKNNKNLILLIVGGGPYLEELKSKCANNKKIYFTGMVDPQEVYKYYKLSDVFVSASQSETQGLTYIEALANGLPLLCKYDDCLDGILKPGFNGYFSNSYEDFKNSIERIFSKENQIEQMSKNALESSKKYSKQHFAKSVYELYKTAVKNYIYVPIRVRPIRKVKSIINNYLIS